MDRPDRRLLAVPTMPTKSLPRLLLALVPLFTLVAAAPTPGAPVAEVGLALSGVRNAKGSVQICLTDRPANFLKCKDDPGALHRTVAAGQSGHGRIALGHVRPGTYALLVFHDENGDRKFNMMLGMPREGFGFSANPAIRMRAPRWEEVRVAIPAGAPTIAVRMRYIL
jgi:uncharacterized protein (DUF2141 family)